jgi:Phospholipase_D-nuclease N-terminal
MVGTVALLGPLMVTLWVFSVADVVVTPRRDVRRLPRWGWLVLTSALPVVGPVAWLLMGRPSRRSRRVSARAVGAFTDYDMRELSTTTALSAQEEFRRHCRDRAQEQRRRYAQQQAAREGF